MKSNLTIALVDDMVLPREALAVLIERMGPYTVVLQAKNGKDYINQCKGRPPADIILLDLNMPVMDGLATLKWIRAQQAAARVLILTGHGEEGNVLKCLHGGANGLLEKQADPEKLRIALDTVHATGMYHTPHTHQVLLQNPDGLTAEERRQRRVREQVKDGALRVLRLLCTLSHPTNERIAKRLRMKVRTVEWHINELLKLMELRDRTELALAAKRLGLVD